MSDDTDKESKTEEPSQKRLTDSLEKGKGPVYRDLPILLGAVVIWLACTQLLEPSVGRLALALRGFIDRPAEWPISTSSDIAVLTHFTIIYAFGAIVPVLAILSLAGVVGSLPQSQGLILERIKPDWSHVSPISGWTRLFGAAGLAQSVKSVVKIACVAIVAVWCLVSITGRFLSADIADSGTVAGMIVEAIGALVLDLLLVFFILAGLDALMARHFWLRGLRMTKHEIKEEAKDMDGNPAIKQRMRQIARRRLQKRMMAAVPRATVVIANPTHYSIALRYAREEGGAPKVIAKGQDSLALRIRQLAEQHGIPIVEDRVLARALYASVPIDAYIPVEFYKAVAQIIMHLMRRSPSSAGAAAGASTNTLAQRR